jgi:hypothetical protein
MAIFNSHFSLAEGMANSFYPTYKQVDHAGSTHKASHIYSAGYDKPMLLGMVHFRLVLWL